MSWSRYLGRGRWDDERARELEAYLAEEIQENVARGMRPAEASRAAHLKLGNATRIREEIYEMNTLPALDTLWRDLRYGVRLLLRTPTFSIVAVLTLALGTGANAAIFQIINAVRLRTLPVERPEELVSVGIDRHGTGRVGMGYRGRSIHTEALWDALRREQQAFSTLFAWGNGGWDLSTEGETRLAQGFYVSGNYFDALGVRPHVGRLITDADDRKGCGAAVAVLSYGFWQSRYGGSSGVLGQTITLDRRPFEIAGVTPPGFFGVEVGRSFDVAVPICAEATIRPRPGNRQDVWWLDMMGRLKEGWTLDGARAHLRGLSPAIFKSTVPPTYRADAAKGYTANTFTVDPAGTGVSNLRTRYATPLWVLLGATALVLLIACANLANLMLARATARGREIAVRMAIGASRGRVIRQLLSESLLIAAAGAALGVLVALWLSDTLVGHLNTNASTVFVDLAPDWRLFAFITLVAAAACLLFGLSPALKATRTDPGAAMHAGGRSSTDTREALTLRRGLVVVQVALSLVLVVGAVLFARTLRNLTTVDLGFRTEGIIDARIDLRRSPLKPQDRHHAYEHIVARMREVPGVQRASEVFVVPLSGPVWNGPVIIDGAPQPGVVHFNQVGHDYFRLLEIPLREGRAFDAQDRAGAPLTAVINEAFARKYFPGGSPLGRTFSTEGPAGAPQPAYRVVGLVPNTKYAALREEAIATAFLPWSQEADPPPFLSVLIRSDMPLDALRARLTQAVVGATPGAAVSYDTIAAYASVAASTERLMASLSGFFGGLAMLIASIGLYGVMSYLVARRRIEIGIRMALGAEPAAILRMVLTESGVLLLAGVAAGLGLSFLAARYAETMLFGLEAADPASFAMAAVTLAVVSLLAAWIPARRASAVAPAMALRD